MKNKKYLIVLILKIMESESDSKHPITQKRIAEMISEVFPCDRKTVGRNIGFLKKIGYPIVKTTKGFYMDKKRFTMEEVNFIVKTINTSSEKTSEEKIDIINRLTNVLTRIVR